MSEGHFHVHGPHDHHLEHASAHGAEDGFAGRIAVTTAVLATLGAIFAYMGGATQANAMLYKNNAAITKTEASNQWNYYQAKSSKQNLAELGSKIAKPEDADKFAKDVEYVDRRSLRLDATILWRTVTTVLRRDGVSANGHVTAHEFLGTGGQGDPA